MILNRIAVIAFGIVVFFSAMAANGGYARHRNPV